MIESKGRAGVLFAAMSAALLVAMLAAGEPVMVRHTEGLVDGFLVLNVGWRGVGRRRFAPNGARHSRHKPTGIPFPGWIAARGNSGVFTTATVSVAE